MAVRDELAFLNYYELDEFEDRPTVEEWLPFKGSPSMEQVDEGRDYREVYPFDRSTCLSIVMSNHIAWKRDVDQSGDHLDEGAQMISVPDLVQDLLAFLHDRLKTFLKDQHIRHDVIDACLAMPGNDDLTLLVNRARALSDFLNTPDGPNLLQGFKRANTILTQAEQKDGVEYSYGPDIRFAQTDEERSLFAALDEAAATITPAMAAEDFPTAMTAMAQLRAPIDAFFTAVQVNDPSEVIRRNRLNLLHRIRTICSGVADLTKIEG
jgi:glycyl-tRNA synthetase beta chain